MADPVNARIGITSGESFPPESLMGAAGGEARQEAHLPSPASSGFDHPILRLSAAGLRHAVRLRHLPAGLVARHIYGYHTIPLVRAPYRTLRGWPEVAQWLGLDSRLPMGTAEEFVAVEDPDGYWMHWRRPGVTHALRHKLYVSPRPEAIPGLFPTLIDALEALGVPAFKCGASARGLLRPDKLVVYFANRHHLFSVAEELRASFQHLPVHGVPFTAPLDATGLLTWGYDPGGGAGSWRLYIAETLARAVTSAPGRSAEHTIGYAREALRVAGVDPDLWEPSGGSVI